ncbi:hypothetical protein EYF80_038391 [Liparis tanakae]|uniref:Uncharacterized protein n=1 Tax=Liparis tanakae TaxID=230148 RepID=A0A4Z2GCZ1_9TELE|nr:hypothetical protein EYF80_038391 [Liparis tanakae]
MRLNRGRLQKLGHAPDMWAWDSGLEKTHGNKMIAGSQTAVAPSHGMKTNRLNRHVDGRAAWREAEALGGAAVVHV